MKNKPLFSIGMPIYNCETYIRNCIESILKQSFANFELLCVLDCPTDSTEQIVLEYATKDSRIKVLHNTTNLGVAFSRKRAIDAATGEYFVWCDSDDIFNDGYLQCIANHYDDEGKKADVCIINAKIVGTSGKGRLLFNLDKDSRLDGRQTMLSVAVGDKIGSYPWSIVCPIANAKRIVYPDNVKHLIDDQLVGYKYFEDTKTVFAIHTPFYMHYLREGTDSHSKNFYERMSSTYATLMHEQNLEDIATSLSTKQAVSWALHLAMERQEKTALQSFSKKLRSRSYKGKYTISRKFLSKRTIIMFLTVKYFPFLFWKRYSKKKRF